MSNRRRYLHLDVFTAKMFGGNQLAVFLDARGLATETMQAVTKEMNFSECTVHTAWPSGATPTSGCASSHRDERCRWRAIPRWDPRSRWRSPA